jgi:hypothetical protein
VTVSSEEKTPFSELVKRFVPHNLPTFLKIQVEEIYDRYSHLFFMSRILPLEEDHGQEAVWKGELEVSIIRPLRLNDLMEEDSDPEVWLEYFSECTLSGLIVQMERWWLAQVHQWAERVELPTLSPDAIFQLGEKGHQYSAFVNHQTIDNMFKEGADVWFGKYEPVTKHVLAAEGVFGRWGPNLVGEGFVPLYTDIFRYEILQATWQDIDTWLYLFDITNTKLRCKNISLDVKLDEDKMLLTVKDKWFITGQLPKIFDIRVAGESDE